VYQSESKVRLALHGAALVVVVIVATGLAVGSFKGAFISLSTVYVKANRSGLLMEPGSDVKVRGVVVGRVQTVTSNGSDVAIRLGIKPDMLALIPSNVEATLDPTTLFGRKFVTLQPDGPPSTTHLAENATIDNTTATVEINNVFSDLMRVLQSVDPSKVSVTLTAMSTALRGNGSKAGQLLAGLNNYLGQFNDSVPTLTNDLAMAADTSQTLTSAVPDVTNLLNNVSTTSDSIVDSRAALSAFLLSLTKFGNKGSGFVDASAENLRQASQVLLPTTALLAQYSPMFPCFFATMARNGRALEQSVGGVKPGLLGMTGTTIGLPPYRYPQDLPVVGAENPPSCYGATTTEDADNPPHIPFNDGSNTYPREWTWEELKTQTPIALLLKHLIGLQP
jgi:phospholipid/cholesterol/gamma-HCH transport system substrate-binding protein